MGRHVGEIYHLAVIILNMVLLINLVIAILSETYTRLSDQKLGLYYDGVIEVIPAYKYRKFYGALIAACPPFNLLIFPFLPIYAFNRKKIKLRLLNNILIKVIFAPFAIIYTTIFTGGNILMIPVAYIVTVYRKFKLIFNHTEEELHRGELVFNFFVFLIFGPALLLIGLFPDLYYFIYHLYLQRND